MKNAIQILKEFIVFFIIGGSIGWLIGLSQAPVINTIITTILSILTMFITFIAGLNKSEKDKENEPTTVINSISKKHNITPFVGFLLGLTILGTFGLWSKNNEKFIGVDLQNTMNEWMSVLHFKNDYSLQLHEIERLKKDSTNSNKIDSLFNLIILDSLKVNKFNELLRFNIAKILFEQRYGVKIDISYDISKELDTLQIKTPIITSKDISKDQKNLTKGSVGFVSGEIKKEFHSEIKIEACNLCYESNLETMRHNVSTSGIKEIIELAKIKDNEELKQKLCEICKSKK